MQALQEDVRTLKECINTSFEEVLSMITGDNGSTQNTECMTSVLAECIALWGSGSDPLTRECGRMTECSKLRHANTWGAVYVKTPKFVDLTLVAGIY